MENIIVNIKKKGYIMINEESNKIEEIIDIRIEITKEINYLFQLFPNQVEESIAQKEILKELNKDKETKGLKEILDILKESKRKILNIQYKINIKKN